MKIKKEKIFIMIGALLLLSYLLETIVVPLRLGLSSPYAFLNPLVFSKYPFTAALVIIRGISLFMIPPFLLSFLKDRYFTKVIILLVIGILAQLLSIQQVISDTTMIPFEWALSLSVAGAALIIPIITTTLKGLFITTKVKLSHANALLNEKIEVDE
jgi:hypothetical protein